MLLFDVQPWISLFKLHSLFRAQSFPFFKANCRVFKFNLRAKVYDFVDEGFGFSVVKFPQ